MLETRDALELRLSGLSYAEIAKELGQPLVTVYERIQSALADIPKEPAKAVYDMELERLDRMIARLEARAAEGDYRAIEVQLKIAARRASLLGIDAPTRSEVEIATKLPDDVAALKDRLAKLLEGGHDQATAADRDPGDGAGGPAPGAGLVGQDEPKR